MTEQALPSSPAPSSKAPFADKSGYYAFHRKLLQEFSDHLPVELDKLVQAEQKEELITTLAQACESLDSDPANGWHLAQNWLFSFVGNHPQLTPMMPRDLLWFLGGDCLHFLDDSEITRFQKVEDRVVEEEAQWADIHRQVFNH